ncbi:DUF3566 domain-containing protein [Micromonospora sp. PLK6-60]|uniref:DUF3566 domain-containing protein n=1 Tax=Micromonospora sp. PLK6-60 TaxID=2873383 RepID=UPI001CA7A7FA|nr:DUF3566 domain-containing protein [Micromonospora sp. PLK6-60]MBY8873557.1 DUF3566 domain-containing protein [Micromonospora sp. PLK6-60]
MTETQAKSGNSGTSASAVDEESADGGTQSAGRAAVGRATVPGEAPAPKFTRAPGMSPPPDKPAEDSGATENTEATAAAAEPATVASKPTPAAPKPAPAGPGAAAARSSSTTQPIKVGAGQAAPAKGAGATGTQARAGAAKSQPEGGARPAGRPASGGGLPPGVGAAAVGAARVGDAVRAARTSVSSAASRGPRRARLNLKRIDPWSVMKFAFAVSVVLFIVVVVATSVLYLALDAMGVFESVNSSLTDLVNAGGGQGTSGFRVTAKGVILTSALVGLVNVVLFTALATLGAFVYNVCADLVGGIELTLAERD